ncbi:MAG: ABC transporter substrate-binding protein [Thiotrichales bacterium]|nr:ABC transporter substrate-binding protein [Thiotrichales bacterium]
MQSRRQWLLQQFSIASLSAVGVNLHGCTVFSPLRIGTHPWIGYETLNLAQTLHLLDKDIQLLAHQNASQSIAKLKSGDLDAATLTLDEAIQIQAEGIHLSVVLIFDISAGADQLIVRPPITHLAELAGKTLGYEASAVGALMLHKILALAQLPASALKLVNLPVGEPQRIAWQKGQVDALVTYEPTASHLMAAGGHRLLDSRAFPETIFDVLVVRSERLSSYHQAVLKVVRAHYRALEHLKTNPGDAIHRIAAQQKVDLRSTENALKGLRFPSAAVGCQLLSEQGRLAQISVELIELLKEQKRLPKSAEPTIDIDSTFCRRYLHE